MKTGAESEAVIAASEKALSTTKTTPKVETTAQRDLKGVVRAKVEWMTAATINTIRCLRGKERRELAKSLDSIAIPKERKGEEKKKE